MKDTVYETLEDAAAETPAPSVSAGGASRDAQLPGWALRAGGNVGRSIASTIMGGAIFTFLGLWLTEQIQGPARAFGENMVWGGAAAWFVGCAWFVAHCRARRGWLGVLLWANLSAVATAWVMLEFSTESLPEAVRAGFAQLTERLPYCIAPQDPSRVLAWMVKMSVALIFASQARRISAFCRAAGRPA